MQIPIFLKEFIAQKDIQKLINNNEFDLVYKQINRKYSNDILQSFTELLNNIGINPLIYMSYIPYGFFMDNKDLTSYIVKSNIKEIEAQAFTRCVNLEKITIPESVENIGVNAFSGRGKLTKIYYNGTKDKFYKIAPYGLIGLTGLFSTWEAIPRKVDIYCADGIIEKVFK